MLNILLFINSLLVQLNHRPLWSVSAKVKRLAIFVQKKSIKQTFTHLLKRIYVETTNNSFYKLPLYLTTSVFSHFNQKQNQLSTEVKEKLLPVPALFNCQMSLAWKKTKLFIETVTGIITIIGFRWFKEYILKCIL